jgi:ABC-2 type transport system ATP-binding protein
MLALSISNLYKTYSNGFHALKGVDLKIEQGSFFGLLGPNGAGKSTLIGIISSLVNKNKGKVAVLGYDIDQEIIKVKSLLGIVPQEINLGVFEKVIDIVVNQAGFYGIQRKIAYERAEKYLNALSLWDKRNEVSRNLSGGMKRRLMIARALVHEPKFLLLDEPTAGVDIEIRHQMWKFLIELNNEGKTILLTSHYVEEIEKLCKEIAIIHEGKIIETDSVTKIVEKLGSATYILELSEDIIDECEVLGVIKKIDPRTIEIYIDKDNNLGRVIYNLVLKGANIKGIRNKQNRLEELFLKLTANRPNKTYE